MWLGKGLCSPFFIQRMFLLSWRSNVESVPCFCCPTWKCLRRVRCSCHFFTYKKAHHVIQYKKIERHWRRHEAVSRDLQICFPRENTNSCRSISVLTCLLIRPVIFKLCKVPRNISTILRMGYSLSAETRPRMEPWGWLDQKTLRGIFPRTQLC